MDPDEGTQADTSTGATVPTSSTRAAQFTTPQQLEASRECERQVDLYGKGATTRSKAAVAIAACLYQPNLEMSERNITDALDSYFRMLDEIDERNEEVGRGRREKRKERDVMGGASNGRRGESARKHSPAPRTASVAPSRSDRRGRSSGTTSTTMSSDSSESESSDSSPSTKRTKPDTSIYAWADDRRSLEHGLRIELRKSLRLLRAYGVDIKTAKHDLLNSVAAPEFPDAEWNNVLRGRAVDLDHVFSGQYSLGRDEKRVEKIGTVEISHKALVPSKTVLNSGDWVIAFQRTTEAISYAFPHRRPELEAYGRHILSLFGALAPTLQQRVIEYDRAVRRRTAAKRDLLLTDIDHFADLKTQYIDSGGANVCGEETKIGKSSGNNARASRRQEEPCRRWNNGVCPSQASKCRYRHVCLSCAGTHTVTQCVKAPARQA
ncbi:hypothetical protein K466DRAFT_592663 [Polyporus arcularius HHB13444]|uniref:C3H1-type domain-containing protein n=1 Tax=Polyporus arcularius HHB13444 TaxID=1314778 RepID=A0A5C3NPD8_9APHY|nr:hypothetical protein K466DRAFT_592663 [Polyporus arcularius HHB13444]